MLSWTLHRRNLVQSWLNYAWRSLHQNLFSSVLFWGSWDGNLVCHVLCVRFLWTAWEIPSFLKGHCGLWYCNGALLMWSQSQLPFFALDLWICSWETKHICKQIFCNVPGEKGNLEATVDIFPWAWDAQMPPAEVLDNQPLLSHEIPVHGFPWNTKTRHWWFGVTRLLCCSASSQGENDKMVFLNKGLVMQWRPAVTMWVVENLLRSKTPDVDSHGKPWLGSSVEGGAGHSSTRRWEREGITMVYTGR